MDISIEQIRKLPASEQLFLAEQIFDDLAKSGQLVQQWQIDEARRRSAELDADPSIALTEEQMWERVDQLRNE
jgi:putative addiction module component (TIGR02574 family)